MLKLQEMNVFYGITAFFIVIVKCFAGKERNRIKHKRSTI